MKTKDFKSWTSSLVVQSVNLRTGASSSNRQETTESSTSLTSAGLNPGNHKDPTSWSWTSRRYVNGRGYSYSNDTVYFTSQVGCFGTVNTPALISPDTAHLYNEALSSLNDRIRGGLDLSVSALQAKQIARQFRTVDDTISKLVLLAKRRFPFGGAAKLIGSKWLEWVYGWRPLLSDIHETVERLTDVAISAYTTHRASARSSLSKRVVSGGTSVSTDVFTGRAELRMKLIISMRDPTALDRFTSLNPLSIGWEVLPYSFVVDWFYDVGGALRNLETGLLNRGLFQSGYYGLFVERRVDRNTRTYVSPYPGKAGGYIQESFDFSDSDRSYTRTKMTSYPLPNMPTLRADLGSGRLLNAAALLSQFLK